jgi:glycogen phosphorylase
LTERLVQGVDVWLNTPRRPWEACGTSGMKVLVNGAINLSELDGWWAEAYTPEVGWALGDGQEHGDDLAWDAVEAEALYDRLEREVISEFYNRDEQGISRAWVARMRERTPRRPSHTPNRLGLSPAADVMLIRVFGVVDVGIPFDNWIQNAAGGLSSETKPLGSKASKKKLCHLYQSLWHSRFSFARQLAKEPFSL